MQQREIPYNYTSLSDKRIIERLTDEQTWTIISQLRTQRKTGLSARMLFEIVGDIWAVRRNPYIQEDLFTNKKRAKALISALYHRLNQIKNRTHRNADNVRLVAEIITKTLSAIKDFEAFLKNSVKQRQRIERKLLKITSPNNIRFDALSRAAHSTDATDWRMEYPICVLTPESEQEIAKLINACIKLGLTIIPRGGGTGYTGSAIPITDNAVVINTEKLLHISSVHQIDGLDCISVGAGVVTKRVSEAARDNNLIFAVDPTSQDASTIGGNIATNAGGKKALRYGTTIDNLMSWKLFLASGKWLVVKRLNHNLTKLHLLDTIEFELTYFAADGTTELNRSILTLTGSDIRQQGLGKDVSNKFLSGLPGVQKEGCDGLITSASFVLHQPDKHIKTFCLEFFGTDLHKAVPAIVEVKDYIDQTADVVLVGLEHLDHRYVKAVSYSTKAHRPELPQMVLLGDISGNDEDKLNACCDEVLNLVKSLGAEGFVAKDKHQRKRFWHDRANTAAIAAHTNAFKINEDVVIPLDKLARYSDAIDKINIRLSIENKLAALAKIEHYLSNLDDKDPIHITKINAAIKRLETTTAHWKTLHDQLDEPQIFHQLQTKQIIVSHKADVVQHFNALFTGQAFQTVRDKLSAIFKEFKENRLFVATHMHAGDGNVHTNIPVHSHNEVMLLQANKVVDEIMEIAVNLGGSISGEHGIGITKYKYLSQSHKEAFANYKQSVDPKGSFNQDKLLNSADLTLAYTPSLRLVEQEALILESSEIGEINQMIKDCVRCGKCKPVCTTHIPEANLLYSPRDKIIGTNLLIEAFLYEEQTRRGISIKHLNELEDISDHCTVCHRCVTPCPVNIDYGDVSVKMRQLLRHKGEKHTSLPAKLSMQYLNATKPFQVNTIKKTLINSGYRLQRLANRIHNNNTDKTPNTTVGKPSIGIQVETLLDRALPSDVAEQTMRQLLGIESSTHIPILMHPEKADDHAEAVFYFPGCGSERLFSQISLSALALLYDIGVKIVLPPSYLCCGYPQNASGYQEKATQISNQNRILFYRISNTLNYLDIKTVLTSCGTCIDQLLTYHFGSIFQDSRLIDIHEYLLENEVTLTNTNGNYLYHAPCHDPIKSDDSQNVIAKLMGQDVTKNERCCGEAGTFALERPDIAKQVTFKKQNEIEKDLQKLINKPKAKKKDNVQMLTTCPACRQGLSRYKQSTGINTRYPIEVLVAERLGKNWQKNFVDNVHIERVLL